jgi:hypothetical protein
MSRNARRGISRLFGEAPRRRRPGSDAAEILDDADSSLLDVVDNLLNKGVVVTGDVVLALADVDLVYVQISTLLCAADRVVGRSPKKRRRHARG